MFDSVRNLAMSIGNGLGYSPHVLGVRDQNTERDLMLWGDTRVATFDVRGPKAFGYAPALARALDSLDPDLLHVHGLWTYSSLASVRWSRGKRPYLVSPHGMLDGWALNNSRWKKRVIAALYENEHLRVAACLHALNTAEADAIRAYGLRNPICVIPNGVELPTSLTEAREARQARILLYLGRLHPKKGLLNLVEAWSQVRKEADESGWRLVIAGWDQKSHRSQIEVLSARLGVNSTVDFVGPQFGAAKTAAFSSAAAFVLPSLSEGSPMTVLEAWSWGLPILMTPQCNLPEGAATGAALMMAPDADSISAALHRLFSMSDAQRLNMGARGRRLVEERFQWRAIGRKMADVYDWVLDAGPKPEFVLD
ncbi:MAG: glycosyltransferase [Bryobacteraceae bacterium]